MFPRKTMVFMALVLGLCGLAAGQQAGPAAKEGERPEGSAQQFLRLRRDARQAPLALEAAIVRCVPRDCGKGQPTVDLVSAVHVAEKGYFDRLNKEFESYDCVLYELVAPQGTRVPKGGGKDSGSPVSMLQRGMKTVLELEFQLDQVDYTRKNMVHADLSPEQFAKSMRDRGETLWGMFVRMMGHAMARQKPGQETVTDVELIRALFDKDRAIMLKRVLAEQFEELGGSLSALGGPEGSTLITERNKAALEVLRKQLAAGKQKVAIFYGAGHMPDFLERLRDDFGLTPIDTRWLTAWDLRAKGSKR